MPYEKLIRDGMVAVLVSPGYGAGWSTWNDPPDALCMDRELVLHVLNNDTDAAADAAERKYDAYTGGAASLIVEWLPVGTPFKITEYDGYETLHTTNSLPLTA